MKLVSWNIEGRLTRFAGEGERGSPEDIVSMIKELDGDVVFLAEAADDETVEPGTTMELENHGYTIHSVDYEDTGGEREWAAIEKASMKLLTKLAVTSFERIRLGDVRNALSAEFMTSNGSLRVIGVHLDDREEALRLKQIEDLLAYLAQDDMPTLMMGDFNAMHGNDLRAKIFRSAPVNKVIKQWPFKRTKYIFQRLSEMASGSALALLEAGSNLRDADPGRKATITPKMRLQERMPSIRMFQIDHMFVTPDIDVKEFSVSRDGGSDHRAISAVINL